MFRLPPLLVNRKLCTVWFPTLTPVLLWANDPEVKLPLGTTPRNGQAGSKMKAPSTCVQIAQLLAAVEPLTWACWSASMVQVLVPVVLGQLMVVSASMGWKPAPTLAALES